MKGVSSIFVMILILVIALALFSMGYIFSTDVLSDILTSTEETLGIQTLRGLAEITIVSINLTANNISVQNSGKVNVSKFNVYVENKLTTSSSSKNSIRPGEFVYINIGSPLNPGDLVKVTTAEGAYAIITVPYVGLTCFDGTPYDSCSYTKPYFCDLNGNLLENCSFCGCPSGYACQPDETCIPEVPPTYLVGFWKFDEGVGTDAYDSSDYKNDGALNGNPQWVSGISDQALEFDGNGDYVEIPFDSSLQVEPYSFTLAAWIKGTDAQNAQNIYVVSLYNDFGFRVAVGGSDNLGMWYRRADSTTGGYNTNHPVLDGTFHYIVVTKNVNNYSFYDNGGYVGGTTLGQELMVYTNVRRIGAWTSSYGNFNGTIDEVQIWNRSLNDSEILAEYQKYAVAPPPGLVGFWRLDENSGIDAFDSSIYGNDGELYSGSTICFGGTCPNWVNGINNSALQFDGTDDHIRVNGDSSLDITSEITIAAWVKPYTDNGYRRIVSKQYQTDQTTSNSCFQLGINTDNRWRWSIVTDVAYYNRLANAVYNPQIGQWYHFVGTYNGTHMVMYLNGQPIRTDSASGSIRVNSSEPLTIANTFFDGTLGYEFSGEIDEVKIWNRALDATEINNEYQKYVPPPQADLIAFWKFDEGSGTTASDSSGNGHNGVIQASGINQISNPSFENDKTGWGSATDWQIVTDEKWHATKSAFFEDFSGDTNSNSTAYVDVPISDGEKITISLYSKGENIVEGTSSWHKAYLIGRWINSTDQRICCADMSIGDGTGTWDWKRSSTVRTAPDLISPDYVKSYQFYFGLIGTGTGTLWVDAVQIDYDNTLKDFTDSPWTSSSYCAEGSCLEFDGYNDYIDVGTFDITSNEMTITAWFKADDFDVGDGRIISKAVSEAEQDHYWMLSTISSGGDMRLRSRLKTGGTTTTLIASSGNLFTDVWTHAAFVYNKTHMLLYKNGVLVGSTPKAGAISTNNAASIWIGDNPGANRKQFDGVIDEVKIYNRSLSESEIYQEYQDGVIHWGISSSSFSLSAGSTNMRCMGGQAPNKPNMKIRSLDMRFAGIGTVAMALYFGGTESNPNGAVKQVEVLNKQSSAGWNTFVLPSEVDWPANQVTWICWKVQGSAWVYYSGSSLDAGDFYTSHGRHDAGYRGTPAQSFPNTLGAASFANWWYETALVYHQ